MNNLKVDSRMVVKQGCWNSNDFDYLKPIERYCSAIKERYNTDYKGFRYVKTFK